MVREDIYAIIMAGGKGERFWPESRTSKPKQLLNLIGELTLIEETVNRLTPLLPEKNIIIITNKDYVSSMRSLLSNIPAENIIGEPVGKDTAPCVALAAAVVESKTDNPDAVMVVVPADHVINDKTEMVSVLSNCADVAIKGNIVTIGVTPSFPSTGYGYIKCGENISTDSSTTFYKSLGFREKPDSETAEKFLSEGCYKWNSGMFVWSVATIKAAMQKHTPILAESIDILKNSIINGNFETVLKEQFDSFDKISIDYAVMEKVDNIVIAECSFDWDDVGSWTALRNQLQSDDSGNVVKAKFAGVNTSNSIIVGRDDHLIATIDLDDMIIVQTDDATLICKSDSAQKVKEIVHLIADSPELQGYL